MNRKAVKNLILATAVSFAGLLVAPVASAQVCSNFSLKGSYGYTVTGSITASSGPFVAGPFAAVGRITFDGSGHVQTVRTLSNNGTILQNDAGTGTYTLNKDCTGSFNITVGPPGNTVQLSLNIVLDDNYELRGIVTNTNFVLVFEGKKQQPIIYF
jgi:hypothetical protein